MERYQEIMVALSESVKKMRGAPPGGEIMMTSYPACNKTSLSRKRCIQTESYYMERYLEVMVALSESIIKIA